MLIDCHTHLDQSEESDVALVAGAREAGVGVIIQSGINLESSRYSAEAGERFPEVYASVGLHPHEAGLATPRAMAEIEELTAHPRVVAVGETGLDLHYDNWPRDVQEEVFLAHLGLAGRSGLPVVIHTRDAAERTLDILDKHAKDLTVVLHCFSLVRHLELVVARGYYVSFAGNVTYKKAADLQEAARVVPAERLLLETDAPWLTPAPLRGRPNRPALVATVYECVAGLRGISLQELALQVEANVMEAFPRIGSCAGGAWGALSGRRARAPIGCRAPGAGFDGRERHGEA